VFHKSQIPTSQPAKVGRLMMYYFCDTCGHIVVGTTSADVHRELGHVVRLLLPQHRSSA